MKLYEIINATQSLIRIYNEPIDLTVAYQLSKRQPEIDKSLKLFQHEREKILKSYSGEEQEAKYQELLDLDVDYNYPPLKIKVKQGISISANDIKLLEPFVTFEEG